MDSDYVIAADGDIILVVGDPPRANEHPPAPCPVVHLKVRSSVLRSASRVFNAMLGPNWREGQRLATRKATAPMKILLPEDDPGVMQIICRALHNPNEIPQEDLNAEEILSIAIHADKYFITGALKVATGHWLDAWLKPSIDEPWIDNRSMTEKGHMLVSALLFGENWKFLQVARTLILNHTERYRWKLTEDELIAQFLPAHAIDLLNDRRKKTRNILLTSLDFYMQHFCKSCGWRHLCSNKFEDLRSYYQDERIWDVPISEVVGKAVAMLDGHDWERSKCTIRRIINDVYYELAMGDSRALADLNEIGVFKTKELRD